MGVALRGSYYHLLIKHQNLFSNNSFHISRPKALIFSILLNKVGSFSLANKTNRINS